MAQLRFRRKSKGKRIALIGAPVDLGAGNRGAALGPAALRAAGLPAVLRRQGYGVVDRGDFGGCHNLPGATRDGCRHLAEIEAACRAVRDGTAAALAAGDFPVMLGGDHSLAIGSVAAVARHCAEAGKPLSLLWLDAHADFNTPASTPSGNVHGMPSAVIAGEGHPLLTMLGHASPMLAVEHMAQIGVRSIDELEQKRIDERGLRVYGMGEIRRRGMRAVAAEALERVARRGGHLHVSFDVDFLDPAVAPGVGTPEAAGPGLEEAALCMEMIRDTGLLGSLDIVELAPDYDGTDTTTRRVIGLVERLLGNASSRRLGIAA